MVRRLGICLCLVAIATFMSLPAFAAVQNVKVGGDIKVLGVSRDNFDLEDTDGVDESASTSIDENESTVSFARVRVDADLTDNVATTVRLLNEREWDTSATTSDELDIDLASIALKEFLYSPLTLVLGRQELRYGNALLVGDPDTNIVAAGTGIESGIGDLSLRKSFDAVKAVLDYDPLVVDLIYAKIAENDVDNTTDTNSGNDDVDLLGVNANYKLGDERNTLLEGYYFGKITGSGAATINTIAKADKAERIHTVGGRVASEVIDNLNLQLESAFQFGSYDPALDENASPKAEKGHRRAWAVQAIGDYKFPVAMDPSLMVTYTYLSGEENTRLSGKYNGWVGIFEDQTTGDIINKIFAPSNSHTFSITAQAKPLADLTADVTYVNLRLAEALNSGSDIITGTWGIDRPLATLSGVNSGTTYYMIPGEKYLGNEVDLHLKYDYTEDVQIGLAGGIFVPGKAFAKPTNHDTATQALASVKVTF